MYNTFAFLTMLLFPLCLSASDNGWELIEGPETRAEIIGAPSEDIILAAIISGLNVIYSRTIDGGETWDNFFTDEALHSGGQLEYRPAQPQTFVFVTPEVCYAGVDSGRIRKTTDLGDTWTDYSVGHKHKIEKIEMLNEYQGFALGTYDSSAKIDENTTQFFSWSDIFFTDDGWKTYKYMDYDSSYENKVSKHNLIAISKDKFLFSTYDAALKERVVVMSDDGGDTWEKYSTDMLDIRLLASDFENIYGITGVFYKENQHGKELDRPMIKKLNRDKRTWDSVYYDASAYDFRAYNNHAKMFESGIGYFCSGGYTTYKTTDFGESWKNISYSNPSDFQPEDGTIRTISFVDDGLFYYAIYGGHWLMKYSAEEVSVNRSFGYDRSSVWPNPARDRVHIRSDLGLRSRCSIELYNSISGAAPAGSYSVDRNGDEFTLDVSALSSGVYIAIIRSGSEARRAKFVITR
jgi:hypothetical protein